MTDMKWKRIPYKREINIYNCKENYIPNTNRPVMIEYFVGDEIKMCIGYHSPPEKIWREITSKDEYIEISHPLTWQEIHKKE